MDFQTVVTLLEAEVLSRQVNHNHNFVSGAAADLMSDVLTYAPESSVLLTGLINPQVVRTAEMAGILTIVFVRGKHPPAETIQLAEEVGIPLLSTRYTMYEACGLLYHAGLPGPGPCDLYDLPEQARK
ncbi:MAG TPA: DRTGG domain-containing protein [Anaerolineae bacterium]|nr:DRTGG domain-containing protein [Anaerolineae bacterium]